MATTQTLDLRGELLARLRDARERTDALFGIIRPEALYDRPIPERHRIVFYIGHLETFDWNLIGRHGLGRNGFEPALDKLFAFGIDPVDGKLPSDGPSDWPDLERVAAYGAKCRAEVDAALAGADLDAESGAGQGRGVLFQVAIEHRLMHAETLAYMLHRMPFERKSGSERMRSLGGGRRSHEVAIPGGAAELGLARRSGAFGWDNEFEAHRVQVPAFTIDSGNVTNGDYLEFVRTGGYAERTLWTEEAWGWRIGHGVEHPAFWRKDRGGRWWFRGMFRELPLPLDHPVYVSHAEARAYARWKRRALPSEPQFHRAAYGTPDGSERDYPWGDAAPAARHGNFDFAHWDPVPSGSYPGGDSAFGVMDLVGNGWEWTATEFRPFEGFAAFPFYKGYSADFFDGKHYVMKGGSPRTAACMLRRSFRNWFQAYYPYVYATFRTVGT